MEKVKFGFVSIIGEANAGKSTLLNKILKDNISIATKRKNTTKKSIKAIYNDQDSQIVFVDTPGFLKVRTLYDKKVNSEIDNFLQDLNIILFLTPFYQEINENKINQIFKLKGNAKIYLIITKIDLDLGKQKVFQIATKYKKYKFDKIIPISSKKNLNINNLIDEIKKDLSLEDIQYSKENNIEESKQSWIEETIRGKILLNFNDEIPHQVLVRTINFKETKDKLEIQIQILVNKNSQKGIIIGKNGEMINKIKEYSKKDIEKKYKKKVYLNISVKTEIDWKNKNSILKEI